MNFRTYARHKLRKGEFTKRRDREWLRKEAVATRFRVRHTARLSLIYQFGSNVNNRAITQSRHEWPGVSLFQETRSTDHVRRARKFSRSRAPFAGSVLWVNTCTRPSRCIAFRSIVNKFRILRYTRLSISRGHIFIQSILSVFFFFLSTRARSADSFRFLINPVCLSLAASLPLHPFRDRSIFPHLPCTAGTRDTENITRHILCTIFNTFLFVTLYIIKYYTAQSVQKFITLREYISIGISFWSFDIRCCKIVAITSRLSLLWIAFGGRTSSMSLFTSRSLDI